MPDAIAAEGFSITINDFPLIFVELKSSMFATDWSLANNKLARAGSSDGQRAWEIDQYEFFIPKRHNPERTDLLFKVIGINNRMFLFFEMFDPNG